MWSLADEIVSIFNIDGDVDQVNNQNAIVCFPNFRAIRDYSFSVFGNSRETDFSYSTGGILPSESWDLEIL